MFLKSIQVTNYRKFKSNSETELAYSGVKDYNNSEKNISKNTTLFIGKNNTGKTSIMSLLSRIAKSTSGSKNNFSIHDINYAYLHDKFKELIDFNEDILNPEKENLNKILSSPPVFEVKLEVGVENPQKKRITSLKDILYVEELESAEEIFESDDTDDQKILTLDHKTINTVIKVRFEPLNIKTYKKEIINFRESLREPLMYNLSDDNIHNQVEEKRIIIDVLRSDDKNDDYTKIDYFT